MQENNCVSGPSMWDARCYVVMLGRRLAGCVTKCDIGWSK